MQRLFDKNLTDLVRGLRNNKDNEVKHLSRDEIIGYFCNLMIQHHFNRKGENNFLILFYISRQIIRAMYRRNKTRTTDRQYKCKMQCCS